MQFGVAEVERNSAIQSMVEVDLGASEAEASALWRDLKALAFPLHDVVVTDDAWVEEAADAVQIVGRRPPSGCGFPRTAGEAAVVVGEETGQNGVGRIQITSLG